jgi:hypothetical protein
VARHGRACVGRSRGQHRAGVLDLALGGRSLTSSEIWATRASQTRDLETSPEAQRGVARNAEAYVCVVAQTFLPTVSGLAGLLAYCAPGRLSASLPIPTSRPFLPCLDNG